MLYSLKVFAGSVLRIEAKLINESQSVNAVNTKLDSGALKPWAAPLFRSTPTKVGEKKSIFRWAPVAGDNNSGFWFHWIEDVNVISGPVNSDTIDRTYFTGDGVPKMTFAGLATSGGTNYPEGHYDLGVPAPSSAPVTALVGTIDPEADTVGDVVERSYALTYVTSQGEEGPPSDLSITLSWLPGQTVDLSSIPAAPSGAYDVSHINIYRTATGSSGTDLYLVHQLAIGNANYSDTKLDANLSEVMLSGSYYQPPADMHSIGVLASGMCYGFSGKQVCVSELYLPHAWSPGNQLTLPEAIIGGGSFGNNIVAITSEGPHVISGIDPTSISSDPYKIKQGCVSKRSCVSTRYGVIYASPDGLILIGPNGDRNIISPYMRPEQWQALKPETILGAVHDNKYIGFYDDGVTQGGFVLDPSSGDSGLVFLDIHATAAYQDGLADSLYLIVDGDLVEWDRGTLLSYTWRSKEFTRGFAGLLTAGRVLAEDYDDLTVEIYADGVLKHTETVTDDKIFRMPGGYTARTYQFEVSGTSKVSNLDFASSPIELARAD